MFAICIGERLRSYHQRPKRTAKLIFASYPNRFPIWRKFYCCVKAYAVRINVTHETLSPNQVKVFDARTYRCFSPYLCRSCGIGKQFRAIYQKKGLAIDSYVSLISKCRNEALDMMQIIFVTVLLR